MLQQHNEMLMVFLHDSYTKALQIDSYVLLLSWLAYVVLEMLLHWVVAVYIVGLNSRPRFFCYVNPLGLISSGYVAADVFKQGMEKVCRARYIACCNRINFLVSSLFFLFTLATAMSSSWFSFWAGLCFWRFLSRSLEIAIAFTRDVIRVSPQRANRSALHKYARLKLALISYAEIFIYSAALYSVTPLVDSPSSGMGVLQGIIVSLSVGSLTNVGGAVNEAIGWWQLLPFVQVFATLSLVVLSLAMYASKKD